MENFKSKSVGVVKAIDISTRLDDQRYLLGLAISRFADVCLEKHGLVDVDVDSLIYIAIDYGIQNNDVYWLREVMCFYGLIKSYDKAVLELNLLLSRAYHE